MDYYECFSFNQKLFNEQIKENRFYKNYLNRQIDEFPIISKQFIKDNYKNIINQKETNSYLHTSGTTGSGLRFPVSHKFLIHQWAVFWKFRIIHNLAQDTWMANIISKIMFEINQKSRLIGLKYFQRNSYYFLYIIFIIKV